MGDLSLKPEADRLYTIKGAADRLGIHWQTVRGLIDKGELRPTRIGRRKLVSAVELTRFIEKHTG